MKWLGLGCLVMCVFVLLFGGCTAMYGISSVNNEVRLRKQVQALSETNKASLDTMCNIIRDNFLITGKWSGDQKELAKAVVEGRKGGALMKMVTESAITMDTKLFEKLMGQVEAKREGFLTNQKQIVDVVRERSTAIETFPGGMFIKMFGNTTQFKPRGEPGSEGWPDDFQYTFVTSAATKEKVRTGEDNERPTFDTPKETKAEK